MMSAEQYAAAFFGHIHSEYGRKILAALRLAENGDEAAFKMANELHLVLSAGERHALSDAVYALLSRSKAPAA